MCLEQKSVLTKCKEHAVHARRAELVKLVKEAEGNVRGFSFGTNGEPVGIFDGQKLQELTESDEWSYVFDLYRKPLSAVLVHLVDKPIFGDTFEILAKMVLKSIAYGGGTETLPEIHHQIDRDNLGAALHIIETMDVLNLPKTATA